MRNGGLHWNSSVSEDRYLLNKMAEQSKFFYEKKS